VPRTAIRCRTFTHELPISELARRLLVIGGRATSFQGRARSDDQRDQRENKLPETVVTKFLIESGRSLKCQCSGP
jgi:hypothetical protein